MRKITILALHLGFGGVEMAIASLANMFACDYEVEIISVYKLYNEPVFKINKKVTIKYLLEDSKPNREEWKLAIKKIRLIKFIKESYKSIKCLISKRTRTIKAIKECDSDFIISSRDIFNNWVGKYACKGIKKIAWEHNHPHGNNRYANSIVTSCRNMDILILVSKGLNEQYQELCKKKKSNCKCLYIPNTIDNIGNKLSLLTENRLISIGRLSKEKGYEDLIDVFAIIHRKKHDWTLDIVGDGKEKDNIIKKIKYYGLDSYVKLHGYQKKDYINALLSKSSIYMMTSFTESFGIVLLEAMSYGIPCVAFSSAEGANEIIINNENGYLIKDRDKSQMAKKVIKLIEQNELREKMGLSARENSLKYSAENVKKLWLDMLKRL